MIKISQPLTGTIEDLRQVRTVSDLSDLTLYQPENTSIEWAVVRDMLRHFFEAISVVMRGLPSFHDFHLTALSTRYTSWTHILGVWTCGVWARRIEPPSNGVYLYWSDRAPTLDDPVVLPSRYPDISHLQVDHSPWSHRFHAVGTDPMSWKTTPFTLHAHGERIDPSGDGNILKLRHLRGVPDLLNWVPKTLERIIPNVW